MNEYFYLDAANQSQGPVPVSRFAEVGITPATKVWCQGMDDWKNAGDVPELQPYFNQHNSYNSGTSYGYGQMPPIAMCPPTYLVWAILTTVLCCLPAGIVSIVYASQVETEWSRGNYGEAYKKSRYARNWAIAAGALGLISSIVYLVLFCLGAFASALNV